MADGGGYAFTADDTPDVIVRMRGAHDDATPNANAIMISNLVALGLLTGKPAYLERAEAIPQAFAADLGKNTLGHCGLLAGFFDLIAPQQVVVIETADADASAKLARAMFKLSLPGAVQQVVAETASGPAGISTAGPLAGKTAAGRQTHRLRLPRPAMLAARDGAGCAAGGAARAAGSARGLIVRAPNSATSSPRRRGPMQPSKRRSASAKTKDNNAHRHRQPLRRGQRDVRLHYLIAGKGDPVLLLHGYAQTSHMWRPLIAELAKTHTVIAPDLRGFGESAKPEGGYDKKTMAQDIHALAASLGLQRRSASSGHDIGLMVAYAYAAQYPAEVERIALMDAFLPGVGDWTRRLAAARPVALPLLRQDAAGAGRRAASASTSSISGTTSPPIPTHSVSEADRQLYAAAYAQPGAMRAGFEVFRAFEQDAKDFAGFAKTKLKMPMLVLTGEKASGEFLIAQGRLVADNVEGVVIKGSGHWLIDEAPDQVIPKLVAFFQHRVAAGDRDDLRQSISETRTSKK